MAKPTNQLRVLNVKSDGVVLLLLCELSNTWDHKVTLCPSIDTLKWMYNSSGDGRDSLAMVTWTKHCNGLLKIIYSEHFTHFHQMPSSEVFYYNKNFVCVQQPVSQSSEHQHHSTILHSIHHHSVVITVGQVLELKTQLNVLVEYNCASEVYFLGWGVKWWGIIIAIHI